MPKENDLEGQQDQGGKHGGQAWRAGRNAEAGAVTTESEN